MGTTPEPTQRPRGYTLADEERAMLEEKVRRGNVLDPIALDDPVGQSVEKVILSIGVTVVAVLIVGILLAQVACKNIQTWGIPDFSEEVSTASVASALKNGVVWGGDIVRFPAAEEAAYDAVDDAVTVYVERGSARNFEQLVSASQTRAFALAMNLFANPEVASVAYVVLDDADDDGNQDAAELLRITWLRDPSDPAAFSCEMAGYDPLAVPADDDDEESL
jgi:hypothetical protein